MDERREHPVIAYVILLNMFYECLHRKVEL